MGIGTTNPGQELEVNGDVLVANNATLLANGTGNLTIGNTNQGIFTVGGDGAESIMSASSNDLVFQWTRDDTSSNNILFRGTNTSGTQNYIWNIGYGASAYTRFFATSFFDGNVGIGVTAPDEALDVVGDLQLSGVLQAGGASSGLAYHQFGTGTKDEAAIASAEDVYISGDLEIDGTLYAAGISGTVTGSGTDNYIPRWNGTTALENSLIYDDGTNIGIGTTVPASTLDVNGIVTATTSFKTGALTLQSSGAQLNSTGNLNITAGGSSTMTFGVASFRIVSV